MRTSQTTISQITWCRVNVLPRLFIAGLLLCATPHYAVRVFIFSWSLCVFTQLRASVRFLYPQRTRNKGMPPALTASADEAE